MRTKQELRDDYAKSTGWENWEHLKNNSKDLDNHINDLIDMALSDQKYAQERLTSPIMKDHSLYAWYDISFPDDDSNMLSREDEAYKQEDNSMGGFNKEW